MADCIKEKSKLQESVLNDKELVMTLQNDNAQLKLQVKEMEFSAQKVTQGQSEMNSGLEGSKQQMMQDLLQSNLELQAEKLKNEFKEKERELTN